MADRQTQLISHLAQQQDRAIAPSTQQQRASLNHPVYGSGSTTGNEPLIIDLPRAPKPGEHWALDAIIAQGFLSAAIPPAGSLLSPVSGFFLVPQNELPETLAQAQAGVNMAVRGVPLPVLASFVPLPSGWQFFLAYNGVAGKPIPAGWIVRMIICCNPGTAAPGPGALSNGVMTVTVAPELDLGVL